MPLPLLSQTGYAHGFLRTGLNAMGVQWKSIAYRACIPARQVYAQTIGSDGMELLIRYCQLKGTGAKLSTFVPRK